jgi:DNA-directed RNA polymerase beta' subunit
MEMNAHLPQSTLTETELKMLAAIPNQIISPRSNAPVIGIFQDSMLGAYRFTQNTIWFTAQEAMSLLMMYPEIDITKFHACLKKNNGLISNFEILSQIMPPLTLKHKTALYKEDAPNPNHILEIQNGTYIRGQFEKKVLNGGTKGIIHRIFNDFGKTEAVKFIDNFQNIITEFMKTSSYSVGTSDLIANRKTYEEIETIIDSKKIEVDQLMQQVHLGIFKNITANSNITEFESQVHNILNMSKKQTESIAQNSLSVDNRFVMIVDSGSKGSSMNIIQMIACLGQTDIDGKRVPQGFDSRTLPHFLKFDDTPKARGFIENSYIAGLESQELFFHAMGGRIGLIDTAVKTSTTGYIQRRLIKGLEDLKVEYDMTVRNSFGKIIQFQYGDDHFDSMCIEEQHVPFVTYSIEEIYRHFQVLGVNNDTIEIDGKKITMPEVFTKEAIQRCHEQKEDALKRLQEIVDFIVESRDVLVENVFHHKNETRVHCAVGFAYLINNIQGQLQLNQQPAIDLSPYDAMELIDAYYQQIESFYYAKPTMLFKILYYYYLSPRKLLVEYRFHKKALLLLLESIVLKYKKALVHPGEMVGIVAGQSLGEPITQLTLNSVTFETEIAVRNQKGEIKKVQIGEFVERHIKQSQKIEFMKEKDTTYAELNEFWEVPSSTKDGRTVWRRIEAVTRHPVVNEDGTNTMLKITTEGCREVTVTKAKSLLQLRDGEIQPVNGKDVKVGDYLPCSVKPLEYTEQFQLDLREILPPTEYVYGSELEKAKAVYTETHWWKKHANKTFTLPHGRSDSAVRIIKKETEIKDGFVYMKNSTSCNYLIPETIELDYDFGYLVGAYCAEGCMTKFQLSIANNDADYFEPILRWCEKHNLTTKIYRNENKNQEGWTSQDLRVYNTVLCRILDKLCGKLSHNKFVSDKIVFSNRQCILGFMDAYIGGDGCVAQSFTDKTKTTKKCDNINAGSVSYKMLLDIQIMIKNLGIISKIYKLRKPEKNNRGSLDMKQPYQIIIPNNQGKKLAALLNLKLKDKQEKVNRLLNDRLFKYDVDRDYLTIPNIVDDKLIVQPRDEHLCKDLIFDPIKTIEEVPNTTSYAYDFTVEDTRTFDCINGLTVFDTFHSSGVSVKGNVTRGVPRIEEIVRLTKSPKNPYMTVFLNEFEQTEDKAKYYATLLEHTRLRDIVKTTSIVFDPLVDTSRVEEDIEWMAQLNEFENQFLTGDHVKAIDGTPKSKWVLRFVMDREKMLDKNITMDDIHFAVSNSYDIGELQCVFTDYNMDQLIFRVRVHASLFKKKKNAVKTLDQSDDIYLLKQFNDSLLNNVILRGIHGVTNVIPRKLPQSLVVKKDGKYLDKNDFWHMDTTGSNLLETLGLDYIDSTRTYSNDIQEIYDVLGIEAAREMIYEEIFEVMNFSSVYINHHHLSLLCDRMTSTVHMTPLIRSGISNDHIGTIAKATFEMNTEMLLDAAKHGDFDPMRGISANVMCGQPGFYGTNAFNVLLDLDAYTEHQDVHFVDRTLEIEALLGTAPVNNECSADAIRIDHPMDDSVQHWAHLCVDEDNVDVGF